MWSDTGLWVCCFPCLLGRDSSAGQILPCLWPACSYPIVVTKLYFIGCYLCFTWRCMVVTLLWTKAGCHQYCAWGSLVKVPGLPRPTATCPLPWRLNCWKSLLLCVGQSGWPSAESAVEHVAPAGQGEVPGSHDSWLVVYRRLMQVQFLHQFLACDLFAKCPESTAARHRSPQGSCSVV